MKTRAEVALAWWAVLTVLGYTTDVALHSAQAGAWIHAAAQMISAFRAAGATPGATLLALAKTLPWSFYLIPLAAGAIVGGIWWAIGCGVSGDDIQRGARLVDSDEGARIVKQRRQ